ncbi:MAG TPA: PhzF family phenazine biosynthesis protein [Thermoleophilaceae bacterium]|nr:PhzF family phenazine biosynthesis protein [Thermoleophilaceae bacterium]
MAEFAWLDVFTDTPLGGNPLAVVIGADSLDGDGMQALAREFGVSETVFVLEEASRLRIFTPEIEMRLAGHPVVGASLELARRGLIPAEGTTVFHTGAGETPVEVSGGVAVMTQAEPEFGDDMDPAAVAPLLGVAPEDLDGPAAVCDTGTRYVMARLCDRSTLARLQPDQAAIADMPDPALGIVAWADEGPDAVAQRMFAPRMGIAEDPATGGAAGALAALRVKRGAEPGDLEVRQGSEIGRPSTIQASVGGAPGAPSAPRVGGRAVLILEGSLA